MHIAALSLLVSDYDKAIDYYTNTLGFDLLEDTDLGNDKRWVRVAPPGSSFALLLAKAKSEAEIRAVGNQAGGRVMLFLHADNFWKTYERYKEKGVEFCEEPREEPYATVVVFKDLMGNKWDLLEPKT